MIHICEPQCKNGSHESFNSGFLHGLWKEYSEISFYAEKTHIQYIKAYLQLRGSQSLDNILYKEIQFPATIYDSGRILFYNRIFKNILNKTSKNDKILFLSITPLALFILHFLGKKRKDITFNVVLHGGIEELTSILLPKLEPYLSKPKERGQTKQIARKSFWARISSMPKKLFAFKKKNEKRFIKTNVAIFNSIFNYRNFFSKNRDLSSFNFIVMSKHIMKNLDIENKTFKKKLCYLPCIFPQKKSSVVNDYPKFAIFGYGADNGFFEDFLEQLDILNPSKNYEVRLISTRGYSGIAKYKNITLNKNSFVPRPEYEKMAEDIDYFLNFYDPSQYRLSCSGSVIEAVMYRKPVIYLGNESYDSFNSLAGPIGIRAGTIENFAAIIFNIIETWPQELQNILKFKENIENVIEIIDISKQLKNDKLILA